MIGQHPVKIAEGHDADRPRLARKIRDLCHASLHVALRNDPNRLDPRRERAAILAGPSVVRARERSFYRGIVRRAYRSRHRREAYRDVDTFLVHVADALGWIVAARRRSERMVAAGRQFAQPGNFVRLAERTFRRSPLRIQRRNYSKVAGADPR